MSLIKPTSLYRVVCRPALPKDSADVLEFTKFIWEGDDYIPFVWHKWLADPEGLLAAAEYAGHAVGIGKLTLLSPGQWWLEGLRVDPACEDRGIASHLNDYLMGHWFEFGDGMVRLATASFRVKVHHLCEKNNFTKISELSVFAAPILPGAIPDFPPLTLDDVPRAVELALCSQSMSLSAGMMDIGWQYLKPCEKRMTELVEGQKVWWWRKGAGLLAFWEDENPESKPVPVVSILACDIKDIPDLLMDYRRLAASLGYEEAAWFAPLKPELLPLLEGAGFKRDWEDALYVYEKQHPIWKN
ncbi:MAG: GNAT family N-acetyltransferase [Anaerolineales bacterium]|nr:GNAT family N-acetyltransferase [Anaerolineales bacterium]